MIPVIALVGQPNVGKSTLFNALTRSRDAIVADRPGLTRDRQYGHAEYNGRPFIVVDTGGIVGNEEGIDERMLQQADHAMRESDVILFLVDARAGVTPGDELIANHLRSLNKSVILVVNKIDGCDQRTVTAEFYSLGFAQLESIAASHNRGIKSLTESVLAGLPETENPVETEDEQGIKLAIVGRPNVGKSTLVNRMLGEERVVVYDQPGTTRDSIYIPLERQGKAYTLIDTAGVRRRGRVSDMVEKFSVIKTLQAIDAAHVVVMMIDAREGIVDQDTTLLGYILEAGKSLVIAVNKWDGLDQEEKARIKHELSRRLVFVDYAKVHTISAKHGTGVGELFPSVEKAYTSATQRFSTPRLTKILQEATDRHQPPLVQGRRIKLRYAHAGGHNPPIIVVHGNQTEHLPASYKRYLENVYRDVLNMVGTPIRIECKSSANPYAHKTNKLTPKQLEKRKRLMRFVKKRK